MQGGVGYIGSYWGSVEGASFADLGWGGDFWEVFFSEAVAFEIGVKRQAGRGEKNIPGEGNDVSLSIWVRRHGRGN